MFVLILVLDFYKGALGMEAEKRVIAHTESSSATLVTMNGDMAAIPGKNP